MGQPYVLPPSVVTSNPPPQVPLNQVWLYNGGNPWADPYFVIDITNSSPGSQTPFTGNAMNDKSDYIAFNLPDGVVMTLLCNPTTGKSNPYDFSGAGVCVDLFGNGQVQTAALGSVGAVNCLSAYIWRKPDLATGVFQLFDGGFSATTDYTTFQGPRNTFFLCEWPKGEANTLAGWSICDRSDAIYFTGLNAQSVILYDGGNGDGDKTGAFCGWFKDTTAPLQDQGFVNKAGSWNWSLLPPKYVVIEDISVTGATTGPASGVTQTSTGVNKGDATVVETVTFESSSTQELTSTVSTSVETGWSISQTLGYTATVGEPGVASEELSYEVTVSMEQSSTVSKETSKTKSQTFTLSDSINITVPPNNSWNTDWVYTIAQMEATPYTTTAFYYYDEPVPGSVLDSTSVSGANVYVLRATVTGVLQGSLAATSTFKTTTQPIAAAMAV